MTAHPTRLTVTKPTTRDERRQATALNRAAIYCRISYATEENQVGVQTQEQDCREICKRNNLEIGDVHVDNSKSAWSRKRKRPGWDSMLDAARRGEIDTIVAWHPDRLMRQPRDLEDLLDIAVEANIRLVGSVGGRDLNNPDDVFILRIEVAHACRSSDDTSRRVQRGLLRSATAGNRHGGRRTFGYNKDGTINEPEAAHVRDWATRMLTGASIAGLAREANARGLRTASGKQFWPNTIRTLLRSPQHAGYRTLNGEIVAKGAWEPILDPDTWEELQDVLAERAKAYDVSRESFYDYVLRGVIRCDVCKRPMYGESMGALPYYRCRRDENRGSCGGVRISARSTEALVEEIVVKLLGKKNVTKRQELATEMSTEARVEKEDIERTLVELSRRLGLRRMTLAEYDVATEPLRNRLAELNAQTRVRPSRALAHLSKKVAEEGWSSLTGAEKNAAYRAAFTAVWIMRARSTHFDPSRIVAERAE